MTVELFNELYWNKKLSYRLVAEEAGVSVNKLRSWIKKKKASGEIEMRSKGESISLAINKGRRDLSGENNPNYKDGSRVDDGIGKRWSRYGISELEYNTMLEEQNGECAICGDKFYDTPNIDHCHSTGVVRGLLCRDCNTGLGRFKDNIKYLNNAIKYLSFPARWDER